MYYHAITPSILCQQGSRDNMSIVIVALPGAPTLNEQVIQADEACNQRLRAHVQSEFSEQPDIDAHSIVHAIAVNEVKIEGLPPGGGIHTK